MKSDGSKDDHGDTGGQATSISVGGTIDGVIDTASDVDYFSASLAAGTLYRFVLTPLTGHPVFYTNATPAFDAGSDGLSLSGTPYWPLTYTAAVVAPDGPASYRISVQAVPDDYPATAATTGTLAPGGTVRGRIEAPGDRDWFAVQLTAGQQYKMVSTGVDVKFGLAGLANDGEPYYLTTYHDASFIPSTSGTFYIIAEGETGGAYSATLTQPADDIGNDPAHARTLAAGATLDGAFEYAADRDAIHVHAAAGHTYRIALALAPGQAGVSDPDFDFGLHDRPGQVVDRGMSPATSSMSFFAIQDFDADFMLSMVDWHGPAGYTVSYQDLGADDFGNTAATAGRISASGVTTAHMDGLEDVDAMRVTLPAGVTYQISLGGPLGSANGGLGLSTSLSDDRFYAKEPTVTPHAGEDTVFYVRADAGQAGDYTVSIAPVADDLAANATTTGRLAIGGSASATLESAGDRDWFAVELKAGATYLFKTSDPVHQMAVVDANGKTLSDEPLTNQDGSVAALAFTSSRSGTYYLEAGGWPGQYTITATSTAYTDDRPGPTMLAPGATVSGTIDFAEDIDSFLINLKAGHLYTVALDTSGANFSQHLAPVALAHLDGGRVVGMATVDDYAPALVPAADGLYRISLSNQMYPTLASYQLSITDYGAGHAPIPGSALNVDPTPGNDVFTAFLPGSRFDGGAGTDTVVYGGAAGSRPIHADGKGGFTVESSAGAAGDALTSIERIVFRDQKDAIALDVAKDAIGGEAWRLYQAAFDRTPDKAGVGYWMNALEHGATLHDVAAGFIASDEFRKLYGANPTDTDFVDRLYQNVLHRAPDKAGEAYWIDVLAHGNARADVLAAFGESAENVEAVAKVIGDGFVYTPYTG